MQGVFLRQRDQETLGEVWGSQSGKGRHPARVPSQTGFLGGHPGILVPGDSGKLWRTHLRASLPAGLRELGFTPLQGESVPQHPGLQHAGGQSRLPGPEEAPRVLKGSSLGDSGDGTVCFIIVCYCLFSTLHFHPVTLCSHSDSSSSISPEYFPFYPRCQ